MSGQFSLDPVVSLQDRFYCIQIGRNRPLSQCLDRCDRMIQNESSNQNGSNVCLFSATTCMSQCKITFLTRANPLLSIRKRVASLTLDCNGVFTIKAYSPGEMELNHVFLRSFLVVSI